MQGQDCLRAGEGDLGIRAVISQNTGPWLATLRAARGSEVLTGQGKCLLSAAEAQHPWVQGETGRRMEHLAAGQAWGSVSPAGLWGAVTQVYGDADSALCPSLSTLDTLRAFPSPAQLPANFYAVFST